MNLTAQDIPEEIKNLKRKVKAGADFLLTQPVFNPEVAEAFLRRYEEEAGFLGVPILVGLLPLFGTRHAAYLQNEVPGIFIPGEIHQRLRDSGDAAPQVGLRIAAELIEQMRTWARGIYLMPAFNRYDPAAELIDEVKGLVLD